MKEILLNILLLLSLKRKLRLYVILKDFVPLCFRIMETSVLLVLVYVNQSCIVQKKKQMKLLNNTRKQTSEDDESSLLL